MDRAIGGFPSSSGAWVDANSAMKVTAVWSAVKILSETIASTPVKVFERLPDDRGKRTATDHSIYRLIHTKPNRRQTSFEWRQQLGCHLALRGNHYSELRPGLRSPIGEIIPLHPDRTREVFADGDIVAYEVDDRPGRTPRILLPEEVLHFQTLSHTGIRGLSIVDIFRDTIGLSLSAEEHGTRTLRNSARPSGALKHEKKLSKEAFANLKESFAEQYTGAANSGKPLILEEGMEWVPISMTPKDLEFVKSRSFQVLEFARIFRIPPHMLADLDRATFSNIEQQSLEFVTYTMLPWFTNLEQRMSVDLLSESDQRRFFIEFVVDGLLRADIKTRFEVYSIATQNGIYDRNTVLRKENENPIGPEGDIRTVQLNLVDLSKITAISEKLASPDTTSNAPGAERALLTHAALMEREAQRMIKRESSELRKGVRKYAADPDGLAAFVALFYERFEPDLAHAFEPIIRSLAELTAADVDTAALAAELARQHVSESRSLLAAGDRDLNWSERRSKPFAALEGIQWKPETSISTVST